MTNKFWALSVLSFGALIFFAASASADIVISNNFDGTADPGETVFQVLDNGANGGGGTFDPLTGTVVVGSTNGSTTASGFNNVTLATLAPDVDTITATIVVSSVSDSLFTRSNGFFLGLATGPAATATDGTALFNNNPAAIGLIINSPTGLTGAIDETRIVTDAIDGGPQVQVGPNNLATAASIDDGFTLELTLNSDGTLDASTTGLSTEIDLTGEAFSGPSFADFVSGGVGVLTSFQGGGASYTIDSVTVHASAVPEPTSLALLGLASLGLVTRRRR